MEKAMKITTALVVVVLAFGALSAADAAEPVPTHETAPDSPKIETDIPLAPGFPIEMGAGDRPYPPVNIRGPVLADLDGGGDLEIVYSSSDCSFNPSCDIGEIRVWDSGGESIAGFPVELTGGAMFAPSVADLDRDGDQEIVQVTVDASWNARVYVVDHQGAVLPGFPAFAGPASALDGAVLHDLDGDGMLEILYSGSSALYVFEANGSQWSDNWPYTVNALAHGSPAVGDVDLDGSPEIFASGLETVFLIDVDGDLLPGWPLTLWHETNQLTGFSSGVMADLDGDRDLELIIAGSYQGTAVDDDENEVSAYFYVVHALHHDGTPVAGWPQALLPKRHMNFSASAPLVTDLEGDGVLEVLLGSASLTRGRPMVYAWDASGNQKTGFPYEYPEDFAGGVSTLSAADIDGDGLMEVFGDTAMNDSSDHLGWIVGIDAGGSNLDGFPLRPLGMTDLNGVVFADIDSDGDYELATATFDILDMMSRVYVYDLPGHYTSSYRDWLTYQASNKRTGQAKSRYRGWRVGRAGSRRGGTR